MYNVFLVEDEYWTLIALKNLIDWGEQGFIICGEALDGNSAWERIAKIKPDIVLSDIKMPGMDGLALMKRIREAGMDTEVVIISGYSDFEYAREGLRSGCLDYLVKPIEESDLTAVLDKAKALLQKKGKPAKTEEQENKEYDSSRKLVKKMLLYTEEHYRNVSLSVLAEEFHMNESYISNLIKKQTGKNFNEYVLEIRIKTAQELLCSTNDSTEEIAYKVGYHDDSHFRKVFKKATGMSASEYRKRL